MILKKSRCKSHVGALLLALLIPTQSFAHAGFFDRYLEYSVSARALFYTTLIVQLFLSVFSFFLLRKTRLLRVVRVSCWHWSKQWYYLSIILHSSYSVPSAYTCRHGLCSFVLPCRWVFAVYNNMLCYPFFSTLSLKKDDSVMALALFSYHPYCSAGNWLWSLFTCI